MPYADPEKQKEFLRKWHQNHKEERNRRTRERYWSNPELNRLHGKLYYSRTKDKKKQYRLEHSADRRKWYAKNKKELYQKHIKKWRSKGNVPLIDNPFPKDISVQFHHLFPAFCLTIPLPKITHNHFRGEAHYVYCNEWIEKIYGLNVEKVGYNG